jgi:hypothetical protein
MLVDEIRSICHWRCIVSSMLSDPSRRICLTISPLSSLRIHRVSVMMWAGKRIRVRCDKGKPVARRGRKA